jgi:hypothetical protein
VNNTAFLIGFLIINTLFLFREFVKGIILSKRLEDAEETLRVKVLEVVNLEGNMGKKISILQKENKRLKEQQNELTAGAQ